MRLKYTLAAVWHDAGCTEQSDAMDDWLETAERKAEESRDAQLPPPLPQQPPPTATQVDDPQPKRQCRQVVLMYCDEKYHCRYCTDDNKGKDNIGKGWTRPGPLKHHIAKMHPGMPGAKKGYDKSAKLCVSDSENGPIRMCYAGCGYAGCGYAGCE
jgi:hypothetical protein